MASLMDRLILKYNNNSSHPNFLSLDRTVGTLASISITLGVYRIVSAALKSDTNGTLSMNKVVELIRVYLGSLVVGNSNVGGGDCIEKGRHGWTWRKKIGTFITGDTTRDGMGADASSGKMKKIRGSCHCQSVRFHLRVPGRIVAQPGGSGKICHPYYVTTAEKFELLCGTKYLSVYYVNLDAKRQGKPSQSHHRSMSSGISSSKGDEIIIAAHTFCSRCGVHIFRAPNSHTDLLEVNVNCLSDDECNSGSAVEIVIQGQGQTNGVVRNNDDHDKSLRNRSSSLQSNTDISMDLLDGDDDHDDDDDLEEEDISTFHDELSLFRESQPELVQAKVRSKQVSKNGTPTASATTSSSTILHLVDSEEDGFSYDDTSTLRSTQSTSTGRIPSQNRVMHRNNGCSLSVSAVDHVSLNDWEMGSSVRSQPLRKAYRSMDDGISLPSMPLPKHVNRPSQHAVVKPLPQLAAMKDRLKYHMKKHHVPSRPSSFRQETIEENKSLR